MRLKRFKPSPADEDAIAARIRLRRENTTKQIMCDFHCSRSFVDRIAKVVSRETNKQNACVTTEDVSA